MTQWLIDNWFEITIPVLVLIACYAVGLWVRRVIGSAFEGWTGKTKWQGSQLVASTVRRPFLFWFLLLGIAIAIQVSILPVGIKSIAGRAIGSLFILSLGWLAIALNKQLLGLYLPRIKAPQPAINLVMNAVRITIILISALVVLDIWGIPTTSLLLFIATAVLVVMLAVRNVAPDLFAWFRLEATQQIRVGDHIKLETGEEGYVVEINWNNTRIKTQDDSTIIAPNNLLLQSKVINYGDPLKKTADSAKAPETKSSLSEREKEIARLIAEGIGNREIAQGLFIAENTVKVHVKNILKKLELRNRQQIAAYTVLQNWATADNGKTQNESD